MGKFPVTADVSGTRCTPPLRELLAASGCHGYELSGSLPTHASLWRSVISGRKEHWFQHNWGLSTLLTTSLYSDPIKTPFDGVLINPHTFLKEDSLCEVLLLQSLRLFSLHQPPLEPLARLWSTSTAASRAMSPLWQDVCQRRRAGLLSGLLAEHPVLSHPICSPPSTDC